MNYSTKTILDKDSFEILEVLKDSDDFEDAFVAKTRHNGRDAALKIAKSELLENEWRALKKLSRTGTAPEPLSKRSGFIIESFIDGISLSDALTGELSVSEAVFLMRKLAESLVAIHRRKVYVNDSHLGNYIVDKSLNIVCIDFGQNSKKSNTCDIGLSTSKRNIRVIGSKYFDSTVVALTFYFMFKDVLSFKSKTFTKCKYVKLKQLLREITYQQSLLEPVDTEALKQKLFHDEASLTC